MPKRKPSFFERLTGAIRIDDVDEDFLEEETKDTKEVHHLKPTPVNDKNDSEDDSIEEIPEEMGELTVDMHESDKEVVIKSIVAGVRPEDLDISITREMVTITGKREGDRTIKTGDYIHQELYWGSFSRTINLPSEVDTDNVTAIERHGLLIIKLPKINKDKQTRVQVKSH